MPAFRRGALSLQYEAFGDGPPERTVVFLHGLLLSAEMMAPLARVFAERFRVVNLELHGHGRSSKPRDPDSYSLREFSLDVIALADHLGLERIGLFGTSLGADVALEAMLMTDPQRVAGAVLEMPVLDAGLTTARRVFKPVARVLRSRVAPGALGFVARRMPAWPPGFPEAAATLAKDPVVGAAVITGLMREEMASRWPAVSRCQVPALIIGHRRDPLHAHGDAVRLSQRLPKAQLVIARSILELRLRPGRILVQARRFMEVAFAAAAERATERAAEEGPTEGTGAGSGAVR